MTVSVKKVLVLGSGGLKVGQAGEFDYSGSQALKALRQEGVFTVLVNPNIATIQTDESLVDTVYFQPLTVPVVTEIIAKERPCALMLNFGGQTALNLGLALASSGVLANYGVKVLGTPIEGIRVTEDRGLFRALLLSMGLSIPQSKSVATEEEAMRAAEEIGYPVMIRSGFCLGGLGSSRVDSTEALRGVVREALHSANQVLVEEYLEGWKEFEYEVVRDAYGNATTVCHMENIDPLGIHTGDSLVVVPAQTLSDLQHQQLRNISLQIANQVGLVGEGNIQYAVNPLNGEYRVIEMNARLSRSSALASKATGYSLAFVSAQLALGYALVDIPYGLMKQRTACFEPTLDYVVVKIPRWDTDKLKNASREIGSQMKSVGEVMAVGRSFPEAFQKAVRMLNRGQIERGDSRFERSLEEEIKHPTDRRLFALYAFFLSGGTVDKAHEWSKIDPWFLYQIAEIAEFERYHSSQTSFSAEVLRQAKEFGFSDETLAKWWKLRPQDVRHQRKWAGIIPYVKSIDPFAGEWDEGPHGCYFTYHGDSHDLEPLGSSPLLILGSGAYAIGSSVEFDWCAVSAAREFRRGGEAVLMMNHNPETVSTDYEESDRLYIEEFTLERILDLIEFEGSKRVLLSVGGQLANNLAIPLHDLGIQVIGTPAESIHRAENREKFSELLVSLGIDQPEWARVTDFLSAEEFVNRVGYPVLLRPSFVLSGTAMKKIQCLSELVAYFEESAVTLGPLASVISKFIPCAKEFDVDAVAMRGEVVMTAISEHMEAAGVHSGDATWVFPAQTLSLEIRDKAKRITVQLAKALHIHGPFNVQFVEKSGQLKVIECNLRATRSLPFVSKVTGHHFMKTAVAIWMGRYKDPFPGDLSSLPYVAVKCPQFSYARFKGADPFPGLEMASTGEVACMAPTFLEAFYLAWTAAEEPIKSHRILISASTEDIFNLESRLLVLKKKGYQIVREETIQTGSWELFFHESNLGLVIVIDQGVERKKSLSVLLRRLAVEHPLPLVTDLTIAQLLLASLAEFEAQKPVIHSWTKFQS
jgi:carbamoyl-phosphate synthase large subunit